jgi:hypothetical protein
MSEENKFLGIYLNDHLAGAVVGLELAKRSLSSNRGSRLGDFLARFVTEVEADRKSLEDVIAALGIRKQQWKQGAAWVAERLGRLKLNGRLVSYSPLSRLEEMEGLCIGVRAKFYLWDALAGLTTSEPRLSAFDFGELARRAETQLKELEHFRGQAAAKALGA